MAGTVDSRADFVGALHEWTGAVMRLSAGGFSRFAKEHGMSMAQLGALFHISHRGASDVSGLGGHMGVTSAAASQVLDRLVEAGLVLRREDPADRRAKRVELTSQGRARMQECLQAGQWWQGRLADALTPRERRGAALALRTLVERTAALDGRDPGSRAHAKESEAR